MIVEVQENSEQSSATKQQDTQVNSVELFLQQKISDPQVQEKIIPIFTDIKKDIPENDILQFLQNNNFNLLVRRSKSLSNTEAKDFLISNILDYFQTIWKSISIINKVEETGGKVEETGQTTKEYASLSEVRKNTKDDYDKLKDEFKPDAKQFADWKNTLEADKTLKQIEDAFPGDQEKIDTFVAFSYTARNFPEAPEVQDFKKNYDELKSLTWIVEVAHDLTSERAPDTLLEQNDDLKSYAENDQNPLFSAVSEFTYFTDNSMDNEEAEKLLIFADKKTQDTLQEQKKFLLESGMMDKDMNPTSTIDEATQKYLATYNELLSSTLGDIQNRLQNNTQSIMRQRTLTSTIQWLAAYFEDTKIDDTMLSSVLSNSPSGNFSITDNVLHMTWNVGNADIGFYYHLNDPEAQLQSDDSMHFDPITKTFVLGTDRGWVSDMGIRMPYLWFLSEKAKTFVDNNIQDILAWSSDIQDFQLTLKNELSAHLLTFYGKPEIASNRIKKQVAKNIAAQDIANNYFPADIDSKKITAQDTPEAHQLLSMFDDTLENGNAQDVLSLDKTQQRFFDALENNLDEKNPKLEEWWKTLLWNAKEDLWSDKTAQHRWTQLLACFSTFAPDGKLNQEDLWVFASLLERWESVQENMSKFSEDFQTANDKILAEELIKNYPEENQIT